MVNDYGERSHDPTPLECSSSVLCDSELDVPENYIETFTHPKVRKGSRYKSPLSLKDASAILRRMTWF